MKIAVIASNSFTGAAIVENLLQNTEAKIIGLSRSEEYHPIFLPYLYKKNVRPNRFDFYKIDINQQLPEALDILGRERPEIVINLAAQGEVSNSWNSPADWFQTNAVGVVGLVDGISRDNYLKRFIQISTPEAYGSSDNRKEDICFYDPSSPYAASKAAGDLFLRCMFKVKDFPVITIRSTNVYGIHQQLYRIIPRTIISIKSKKKLQLQGGGKAIKSYLHVNDVADGVLLAIQKGTIGDLYHMGPYGSGISIRALVEMTANQMGKTLEEIAEEVPDRPGQDSLYVLDWNKAHEELGWKPRIDLENGIGEMIAWISDSWDEIIKQPQGYVHKK